MSIIKEEIVGDLIKNEIKSTNIKYSEYNTKEKTMLVIFNNEKQYVYFDVPHSEYTKFRLSESQGKYFSQNISRKYKYGKI